MKTIVEKELQKTTKEKHRQKGAETIERMNKNYSQRLRAK